MNSEMFIRIIQLILAILSIVITTYIIPYIKAKVGTEKFNQVKLWTNIFVDAAEQTVTRPGAGQKKLILVTDWLKNKLRELGVELSDEQIRLLIEDAVYNMKKAI